MWIDGIRVRVLTQSMHVSKAVWFSCVWLTAAMMAGCSTPKTEPLYSELPGPSGSPAITEAPESVPSAVAPPSRPVQPAAAQEAQAPTATVKPVEKPALIVTPDTTLTGAVVSVNEVGRFVVLRFPLGRMPTEGAPLYVYRQGLKVADLKVTGPQKDDHTVADIALGECRVNDEVRDR